MTHEFDGKQYAQASAHQKEWGQRLISELDFSEIESIMDLGCGDGALTQILSEMVPGGIVVGIDASQGMINVAKEKMASNLDFILMDINDLKVARKFDLIFSNATLHWVKDHQALWGRVFNLLNPNGVVRFNFAADGNCSNYFDTVKDQISKKQYREYFKDFDWPWYMPALSDYRQVIEKYDFSEIEVKEENADRFFPDESSMIGWLDQPSLVPFLKYLPESSKSGFREEVIDTMLSKTLQNDGQCFETFRRIDIFARKYA